MKTYRHTIGVAIISLALLPTGVAAASTTALDDVRAVAQDAAATLELEQQLLQRLAASPDSSPAELDDALRALDAADADGHAALRQLQSLDVRITEAMRVALDRLPTDDATGAITEPPPGVVYAAALDDLNRIADNPTTAVVSRSETGSPAAGLMTVALLSLLALGAAALGNAVRQRNQTEDLEAMTWNDGLTGVANRRRLDHDVESHEQSHTSTAVIMLDIDRFKSVNDRFGHRLGDEVLQQIGAMISSRVRYDDVVYRYGGEEFCVLLPGASPAEAYEVGQRIVAGAHSIELPDGNHLTVSLGVADAPFGDVRDAIHAADEALYIAKDQGRDRVVVASAHDALISV